jgi:hypothetical protein
LITSSLRLAAAVAAMPLESHMAPGVVLAVLGLVLVCL